MTHERLFFRLDGDPACAPGTTVPDSTLREFAVPDAWRSLVTHVTAYEERFADGEHVVERVVPDGATRLLISLEGGGVSVHVAGASAKPVVLEMRGHMHGISVTLRPGASVELFGIPADEITDDTVPWDSIASTSYLHLPSQLAAAQNDAARVQCVLASLMNMRQPAGTSTRRVMAHATSRLGSADGMTLRTLAAELGLSERRVQQLFASHLGLTPGVWRRLQRLHGAMRRLRTTRAPQWTQFALDTGYYDQAHLINEFRALCGLTPGQLLRRVSHSSNT